MKPKWHRVSTTLCGNRDQTPGTVTVFFDYNLLNWTFGLHFENDGCWRDMHLHFGPFSFSFCYWRHWVNENSPCWSGK